jgi:pimeloyl-ACP methyl ester carboxylesterase
MHDGRAVTVRCRTISSSIDGSVAVNLRLVARALETGTGDPLVLVHGSGMLWGPLLAALQDRRVSAFDLAGFGLSDMRGDPFFRAMTARRQGARAARGAAREREGDPPRDGQGARPPRLRGAARLALRGRAEHHDDARPAACHVLAPEPRAAPRRPRPENVIGDHELRTIDVPVRMIMGDDDVYGGPEICERAVALMPDAALHVLRGWRAPFLDDPPAVPR